MSKNDVIDKKIDTLISTVVESIPTTVGQMPNYAFASGVLHALTTWIASLSPDKHDEIETKIDQMITHYKQRVTEK